MIPVYRSVDSAPSSRSIALVCPPFNLNTHLLQPAAAADAVVSQANVYIPEQPGVTFTNTLLVTKLVPKGVVFAFLAGAYLVNVAVKQPSSHWRDLETAQRLWEETSSQIQKALDNQTM